MDERRFLTAMGIVVIICIAGLVYYEGIRSQEIPKFESFCHAAGMLPVDNYTFGMVYDYSCYTVVGDVITIRDVTVFEGKLYWKEGGCD